MPVPYSMMYHPWQTAHLHSTAQNNNKRHVKRQKGMACSRQECPANGKQQQTPDTNRNPEPRNSTLREWGSDLLLPHNVSADATRLCQQGAWSKAGVCCHRVLQGPQGKFCNWTGPPRWEQVKALYSELVTAREVVGMTCIWQRLTGRPGSLKTVWWEKRRFQEGPGERLWLFEAGDGLTRTCSSMWLLKEHSWLFLVGPEPKTEAKMKEAGSYWLGPGCLLWVLQRLWFCFLDWLLQIMGQVLVLRTAWLLFVCSVYPVLAKVWKMIDYKGAGGNCPYPDCGGGFHVHIRLLKS